MIRSYGVPIFSVKYGRLFNGENIHTFIGATKEADSHRNLFVPFDWMDPNVSGYERRVQIVNTLGILIRISTKYLKL